MDFIEVRGLPCFYSSVLSHAFIIRVPEICTACPVNARRLIILNICIYYITSPRQKQYRITLSARVVGSRAGAVAGSDEKRQSAEGTQSSAAVPGKGLTCGKQK